MSTLPPLEYHSYKVTQLYLQKKITLQHATSEKRRRDEEKNNALLTVVPENLLGYYILISSCWAINWCIWFRYTYFPNLDGRLQIHPVKSVSFTKISAFELLECKQLLWLGNNQKDVKQENYPTKFPKQINTFCILIPILFLQHCFPI